MVYDKIQTENGFLELSTAERTRKSEVIRVCKNI